MNLKDYTYKAGVCLLALSLSGLLPATPTAPARMDKSILDSKTIFVPKPISANWNPDAKVISPAKQQEAMGLIGCGIMIGLFGPLVWFAIKNDCSWSL
jgi:hypothetical protein